MKFNGFDEWIAIFQGGKQKDSNGVEHDGNALIDKAIATFNAEQHEPPAVIGHPETNAPAYGWVEGLKKEGNLLMAKFKQVQPVFADMVKQGLFKKRSAAFYPDGRLRHVGFLGAMPPAVKGLPDVAFAESASASFEFAANDDAPAAQAARSKKWNIGIKEGGHLTKPSEWKNVQDEEFLDPVNYRYPCPDANQTRAAASFWGRPKDQEQYSEEERTLISGRLTKIEKKYGIGKNVKEDSKMFEEFLKKLSETLDSFRKSGTQTAQFSEADIEALKTKAAAEAAKVEREKVTAEFAEKEKVTRLAALKGEIAAFCEAMVKQGRLTPAGVKFGIPEMLLAFAGREDMIEFGETKEKATLYARFKAMIESATPLIHFGEIATRGKDAGDADTAGAKIEALTQAKMKANKDLSYSAAFAEVQSENPELAKEYQLEIQGQ